MPDDLIWQFIRKDALILIPTLYILGLILRQTPKIPVWTHAWILLFVAVFSCLLYYGWEIQSVVQGILVTGVAILAKDLIHKTIAQSKDKKDDDKL